ncbi:hypothetical protein S83_034701, partial [Arachis hypogaea]
PSQHCSTASLSSSSSLSLCSPVSLPLSSSSLAFLLAADCGMENTLKPGDVIQCRECGYRILYKKRTRRSNRNPNFGRLSSMRHIDENCCGVG